MKCPGCKQNSSSGADFCRKCGAPVTGGPPYAELQRALTEALEQQTAAGEIEGTMRGWCTSTAMIVRVSACAPAWSARRARTCSMWADDWRKMAREPIELEAASA